MRIDPYLYFNGCCEEALEFYRQAIGAEITALTRFKDSPGAAAPAGAGDKVLHAQLRIGDATVMASDGQCHGPARFEGFSLALSAARDSEAERQFAALAQDGHVRVPMTETPFASRFGMVQDRFGVLWTVAAQAGA